MIEPINTNIDFEWFSVRLQRFVGDTYMRVITLRLKNVFVHKMKDSIANRRSAVRRVKGLWRICSGSIAGLLSRPLYRNDHRHLHEQLLIRISEA